MSIARALAFSNEQIELAGTLWLPPSPGPHPGLVVLHAADGGSRSFRFYHHLTNVLPQYGIAVFIYDRRGTGLSTGDFTTASFRDLATDAVAAVNLLKCHTDLDPGRIGLYGISQGGWIAPIAASRSTTSLLVIVSGSGVSPAAQMNYGVGRALRQAGYPEPVIQQALNLRKRVDDYFRGRLGQESVQTDLAQVVGKPWFELSYLPGPDELPEDVTHDKWYYELDYDPLGIWSQVKQPTLFLFAEDDEWVPVADSMALYRAATAHLSDVVIRQIRETNHLMGTIRADNSAPQATDISEHYLEVLINWLAEHFALPSIVSGA